MGKEADKHTSGMTRHFKLLSKNDVAIAGGKGASLGEMTQAGIPVPPGFVVLTDAFEQFLDETDLRQEIRAELAKVDDDAVHTAERASEQIQNLIKSAEMPKDIAEVVEQAFADLGTTYVAVRSSATSEDSAENAWAGQLDSFLNTTRDTLLENVKNCWASLFTPRAIFYRIEKGLKESHVSVAVVVQKMVESESSGIAFSVHPVTEDPNQLIIEAGFGLGEAIVSGSITPDSYVVEKEPLKIIDTNVAEQTRGIFRASTGSAQANEWRDIAPEEGSKQVLSDEEIIELSELISKIEQHYGFPVDIEWARENDSFYIVQSRPITTLSSVTAPNSEADVVSRLTSGHEFEKVNDFPFFPVITLEPMPYGYEKNPYYTKIGVDDGCRVGIGIIDDVYEGWVDRSTMPVIENQEKVKRILQDTQEHVRITRPILAAKVESLSKQFQDAEFLCNLITEIKQLMSGTYQLFSAYLDDSLVTDDEVLMYELQQARIDLDCLATDYFTLHNKMLSILESHFEFPLSIVERCTTAEILALLRKETDISKYGHIATRPFAIFSYEDEIHLLLGKDVARLKQKLHLQDPYAALTEHAEAQGTISGSVGHTGVVCGEVCVLHAVDFENVERVEEISKKEGCILVTPMTRPELVPHLQNVGAFVTNEGGITCHAAIIARELGVPCVVGTKVATQVLKDGDLVEVDAERGVVTILEKAGDVSSANDVAHTKDEAESSTNEDGAVANEGEVRIIEKTSHDELPVPTDYTYIGQYTNTPWGSYFWHARWRKELAQEVNFDAVFGGWLQFDDGHVYFHTREAEKVIGLFQTKINENDTSFFQQLRAKAEETFAMALDVASTTNKQAATKNVLRTVVDEGEKIHFYWSLGWQLSQIIDDFIQKIANKHSVPSTKLVNIVPKFDTPMVQYVRESYALKKILQDEHLWRDSIDATAQAIQNQSNVMDRVERHIRKYAWIVTMNWRVQELTLEALLKQLSHAEDIVNRVSTEHSAAVREVEQYKDALSIGALNQLGAEYASMFEHKVFGLLSQYAEQHTLSTDELFHLMPTEVIGAGVRLGDLKATANKRMKEWCMYNKPDNTVVIIDDAERVATLKQNFATMRNVATTDELRGVVGNAGKVTGSVKVILEQSQFSKLERDDILVSSMTTPDFVLIMQKAGGIITEMGGTLSHAAIVSRELGKPCIMSVHGATTKLKDGDIVELDADAGVIRIK